MKTTVYFATNRNPKITDGKITGFGKRFSPNGLDDLRFGVATVTGDSIKLKVLPDTPKQGSKALFKELKKKMCSGRDTIVYIHGYNTTFDDALLSGAAMAHKYAIENTQTDYQPHIFVFSWPSDGQKFPPNVYSHDRRDARASALPFARGFMKLSAFLDSIAPEDSCQGKLHLIAHSMGVYVLRYALQEMRKLTGDDLRRVFEQIILAAADEDEDSFEYDYKLSLLPKVAQRITVYFNNRDVVLVVSDKTKNNPDRLGHDGPRYPHQVSGKVVLADVTGVPSKADPTGHSYYLKNERVIKDFKAVFLGIPSEKIDGRKYVPHANKFRLK